MAVEPKLRLLHSKIKSGRETVESYSLTEISVDALEGFAKDLREHSKSLGGEKLAGSVADIQEVIAAVYGIADTVDQLAAIAAAVPERKSVSLAQISTYNKALNVVKSLRKNLVESMGTCLARIEVTIAAVQRTPPVAALNRRSEVRSRLEAS